MLFIIYSATDESSIKSDLGLPEYSYYFVLKEFRPLLERLGRVVVVKRPEVEVDPLYDECVANGEPCVFLSFSPPNKTLVTLRCPTIPVFAWEFDTIPDEVWDNDPCNDWTYVLGKLGRAVTHSQSTVRAIKNAMGDDFHAVSIPSPVWDRFSGLRSKYPPSLGLGPVTLNVRGSILDSSCMPLRVSAGNEGGQGDVFRKSARYRLGATKRHFIEWYRDVIRDLLPGKLASFLSNVLRRVNWKRQQLVQVAVKEVHTHTLTLDGIIYTSVLNPYDGRKNWSDMVTAFLAAFADVPNATLVLKFTHLHSELALSMLSDAVYRSPPFKCRLVGIHGYLEDDSYEQLIAASTYTVNSSVGEGQCLPLMEFMACGKPAVSPLHTAMEDYIDEDVAFIVNSNVEPSIWPHDPRIVIRAHKYRVDWGSLRDAFIKSHKVAETEPSRYLEMAANAIERMSRHASHAAAARKITDFLEIKDRLGAELTAEAAKEVSHPDLPRLTGLWDARKSGWFDSKTGELAPGFPIGDGDIVVDAGCGSGGASQFCVRQGAEVYFLDVDAEKVALARKRLSAEANSSLTGIVSDCCPIPLKDNMASKVMALEMLEHVSDPDAVMKELVRIGKPGALYLISVPGQAGEELQKSFADPGHFESPNHVRVFSKDEFESLVERSGLIIERQYGAGFYWTIWMCFFWACQKASGEPYTGATMDKIEPPYPDVLNSWADAWFRLLKMPEGMPVKQALDSFLPKSSILIARKP